MSGQNKEQVWAKQTRDNYADIEMIGGLLNTMFHINVLRKNGYE